MIELGDRVQDTVTKFKGIAMARAVWLHGCDRIAVQPQEIVEGRDIPDAIWFDEPVLRVMKKAAVANIPGKEKPKKKPGGPHSKKF